MASTDDVTRVWDLAEKSSIAMLASWDGQNPHSRPMHAHLARNENAFYFLADRRQQKDDDIAKFPTVCLAFADVSDQKYVSISGEASILNDRANDADKRVRIDKKSHAGYVSPVAIRITYAWPTKGGKPEHGQYSTWSPVDALPFPVEAGGPDVSKFSKEWAIAMAKHDPASWINRNAFPKLVWSEVGKWVYDVFTGKASVAPKVDLDTADFGELLEIVGNHPDKFADLDVSQFSYDMVEALREIVKGTFNAVKEVPHG